MIMDEIDTFPRHGKLQELLARRNPCRRLGDAILVSTDVLLPNGSKVVVVVEGGATGTRVTVSDAGAALIALAEAGLALNEAAYASVKRVARSLGLALETGVLRSEPVPPEEVSYAVVVLANGAREVAQAAFEAGARQERRRFRERVEQELARIFGDAIVQKSARLRGASEDSLRFDYLVTMSPHRRLVVDAPVPDGSSIAAVVLRQTDMRAARVPGLHQAIVYDEGDHWRSTSLAQLQLAQVPLVNARSLEQGLLAASRDEPPLVLG